MAQSPHERCGLACQALGVAAVNAGFAAGLLPIKYDQHWHMLPEPSVMTFPCGCFWINDDETVQPFGNVHDRIGYPIHWVALDRKIAGTVKIPSELLMLRYLTARAIHNQTLPGVPESDLVEWRPGKVVDENLPIYQFVVSSGTFICWCKIGRGLV